MTEYRPAVYQLNWKGQRWGTTLRIRTFPGLDERDWYELLAQVGTPTQGQTVEVIPATGAW